MINSNRAYQVLVVNAFVGFDDNKILAMQK